MFRKSIVGIAFAVGILSIAIGVQRWFDSHAAENVVHSLMHAVINGDRATALSLLSADRRGLVDTTKTWESPTADWTPQKGVSYEIVELEIHGDTAVAGVRMEKEGFTLQPLVHLQRNEMSRWKVDRVEGLEVDPQYARRRRAYERQQGEQLAERLQQALQDRPGVTVKRVEMSKLPRDENR